MFDEFRLKEALVSYKRDFAQKLWPNEKYMFKEVADIKTADMLELPVPDAHFHNVAVKPSKMQKEMVASLAERAEKVRGGGVDSSVDNMLKITNDGRKLALDQRLTQFYCWRRKETYTIYTKYNIK